VNDSKRPTTINRTFVFVELISIVWLAIQIFQSPFTHSRRKISMVKAATSKTTLLQGNGDNENTRLEKNIEFLNQSDSHIESSLSPVPLSLRVLFRDGTGYPIYIFKDS